MDGKVHGKQLVKDTLVKSLNGSLLSTQYLISDSDSNITLDIKSEVNSPTHSFILGWSGILPIERGGLNNDKFEENEIIIKSKGSIISSGYKIDDDVNSKNNLWSSERVIEEISKDPFCYKEIPRGEIDGQNQEFILLNRPIPNSEHVFLNGVLQMNEHDYSISENIITFFSPIPEFSVIVCTYKKNLFI
jgi:hypothetical protein